jgi:single-stranded DNA-binding protein
MNCAGTPSSSGSELNVGSSNGTQYSKGVGNTESIKLTAVSPATSDPSRVFRFWTTDQTTPPTPASHWITNLGGDRFTICVNGFSGNGSRFYFANFEDAPTVVAPPAGQSSSEGSSQAFNLGSFTEPVGVNDSPYAVTVDWGDGSPNTTFTKTTASRPNNEPLGTQDHTYADGPATRTVTVTVTGNGNGLGGASGSSTFTVSVTNVAPTATLANNGPVNEGSAATISFSAQSDASSADMAAGFHYAYSCDGSAFSPAPTYAGTAGSTASTSCSFNDDGSKTVRARIIDKDNGFTEYTTTVTVTNVAPTVSVTGAASANEGDTESYSYSWTDPGSADTFPALGNSVDCGVNGTSSDEVFDPDAQNGSFKCTWPDDSGAGTADVSATVTDDDGGADTDTINVSVANVAPSATFNAPSSVNEGSDIDLSLTSPSDPSSVDTTAGFTYAFDCGSGYGAFSGTSTGSCPTNDNGSRAVKGKIKDKDGGVSEYTDTVTIDNIAPTASATNNGPIDEGQSATVTTSQTDPGADTFEYAFDCNNDSVFSAYGASDNTSCSFGADGDYTVGVKVRDDDDGVGEASTVVHVLNAAPSIDTLGLDPDELDEGDSTDLAATVSDPGSDDTTLGYSIDWGDGWPATEGSTSDGAISESHAYADDDSDGTYTVTLTVSDSDDDSDSESADVQVHNVAPTADFTNTGPVDEGSSFTLSMANGDDVSSVDKAAKFTFAFDCGDGSGYGAFTLTPALSASATCPTDDNGTHAVKAKIRDKDGGVREHTASVTVANVAPSATFNAPSSVSEGSNIDLLLSDVIDPGTADTFEHRFKCGDGSWSAYGASASHACPTDDNGLVTVKGQLRDDDGGESDIYSADVMVNNVAPTVTLTGAASANEGDTESYSYSWTDPGSADTFPALGNSVDCGINGTSSDEAFDPDAQTGSFECTWSDDSGAGTADVSATVTDDDDGADTDTINVSVANVAPKVNLVGPNTADEGETKTYSYTITDPGSDDTFSFAPSYPTCGLYGELVGTPAIGDGSFQCHFPDGPNTTDVKTKVQDDDGGVSVADSEHVEIVAVAIANVAPTVAAASDQTSHEGELKLFSLGSFSDVGTDSPWAVDVDWGDSSSHTTFNETAVGPASNQTITAQSHTYEDNGLYTVAVTVTDKDGASDSKTFQVTVTNVAPTVTLTGAASANEGDTESYSYSWTDPGSADTFPALGNSVDCGINGTSSDEVFMAGSKTGSFKCHWTDDSGAGTADVSATVTDDDDGADTDTINVSVANVAPSVELTGETTVDEGSSHTYAFTVSDPGGDTFSIADMYPKCGDNGEFVAGSLSVSSSGGSFGCRFPDGPATTDVAIKVADSDGASTTDSEKVAVVTVANVSPAVTAPANQNSNEGENHSFVLGSFTDPGADTWTVDVDWGDGTTHDNPAVGSAGNIPATQHEYDDNGTYTVTVKVTDDDGAYDSKTFQVSVANLAPTGTLGNNGPINEGGSATVSFTAVSDPSTADSVTLRYAFDCAGGPLDAVDYDDAGTVGSTSCSYDDGLRYYSVSGVIIDKDGGRHDASTVVRVNNVAPSATFNSLASVNEGSSFTLSLTSASDPSTADAAAGFQYKFDCGDGSGYGAYGSSNSATCPTNDSGTRSVTGKIKDKDGGEREYAASVTVNNVAPSATFSHNGPVDEGSSFTISLADPSDPSSVDTAAGFQYAFNCGSGYAAYGSATSRSCPTTDNGVRAVKGKIKDKDGDEREYTGSVTVVNVAPMITNVTASDTFAGSLVFMTSSISTYFTDPGSADTWTNLLNFSDGGTESGTSPTAQGGDAYKFTLTHSFATPGCKTVMSKVTDDDGGYHTFGPTPVNVGTGQFLPPVTNTPVTNKLKNGQVLPVKIKLIDCSGAPITNLSPAIVLKKGDMTVFNDDSVVAITPGSVSGADTTGVMRSSGDGSYIYNMSVNITLNADYTILIYPYGTGTPTQYLAHVIQATK